jgi:hypothetical protein
VDRPLVIRCFQILVTLYAQVVIEFSLTTGIDFLWYFLPHKTHLRERLEVLKLGLETDWVTAGFAMTIASLSQWRTISIFHIFLCSAFATWIPDVDPTWKGLTHWQNKRLKIIYSTSYRILRLATWIYVLYLVKWFWSNKPGQCFISSLGDTSSSFEARTYAVFLMAISILMETFGIIVALVYINKAISYRSREGEDKATELQDMKAASIDNQKTQDTAFWTKRQKRTLIFLAKFVLKGLTAASHAYWVIGLVLANRAHISGDEYCFSFGQVSALVLLATSFYKMWSSYVGKSCVPFIQAANKRMAEHKEQQKDSSTGGRENIERTNHNP